MKFLNTYEKKEKIRFCYFIFGLYLSCSALQFVTFMGIGIVRAINIILLISYFIYLDKKKINILCRENILLIIFLFYSVMGSIWSIDSKRALNTIIIYVLITVTFIFLSSLKWNKREKKLIIIMPIISHSIIAFLITFNISTYSLGGRTTLQLFGKYGDPNFVGINISFSILLCMYLLLKENINFIYKIILSSLILLKFSAVVTLASRGTLITLSISFILIIIERLLKKPKTIVILPILIIVLGGVADVVLSSMPPHVVERLDIINALEGGGNGRFDYWSQAISYSFNDLYGFLFGFGPGQMPIYVNYAHNFFIDIFFDYGIVGLILILNFLIYILYKYCTKDIFKLSLFFFIIISSLSLSTDRAILFWNVLALIKLL